MGVSAQPSLRFPLLLLAAGNLAALGLRLWPWQEVLNLPGNGMAAFDLGVLLLGYIGFAYWLGGSVAQGKMHNPLAASALPGVLAGLALMAMVLLESPQSNPENAPYPPIHWILLLTACLLWGVAGLRGRRATGSSSGAALAGFWSGMVAAAMACSAVMVEMLRATPPPAPTDPWKQYESLAIANPLTPVLLHALSSATWFVLVSPFAAAALGLLCGGFGAAENAAPPSPPALLSALPQELPSAPPKHDAAPTRKRRLCPSPHLVHPDQEADFS
jgi:hypothetical protein